MRTFVKSALVKVGLVACCTLAVASTVNAQKASPERQAVEARQALFKVMEWNMAPLGSMLKRQRPFDAAEVQKSAARLEALATMIPEVFSADTRKSGLETRARDGIWTSQADFKAKNDDFLKAVSALSAAAKGGDQKAVTQAIATVGKSCGACHDNFRDD